MAKSNVIWMEWQGTRSGEVRAFAVDSDEEKSTKTGVLRAVNGSLVPDGAAPAKRSTPRDEFSVQILANREAKAAEKSAREQAKAEAKAARAAEGKPARKRAPKAEEKPARKRAAKTEKAAAPKRARRVKQAA